MAAPLDLSQAGPAFQRQRPFDDDREVIVRRGTKLGFRYGLELGRRSVRVGGVDAIAVRYRTILSPPPLMPAAPILDARAAKRYTPESDVVFLDGVEVLIRREPDGFDEHEVDMMLASARRS